MNSGIYKIRNNKNGKYYIGSSSNLKVRKSYHFSQLRRNIHKNTILQNSFNKYKEINFIFETVELCNPTELIRREQYYIDTLKPPFNIRPIAHSNIGMKYNDKRSPEERERIRLLRVNISPETRDKMRKYKYMLGKKHSDSTKERMRNKKSKPIIQYSLSMVFVREWNSAKEAELIGHYNRIAISNCCNSKTKKSQGFIWKFKNKII